MPKTKTFPWDPVQHLESEEDMAAYLEAALEKGAPSLVAAALGDIARAKGMTQLARDTGLGRESLYKALSPSGDPEFAIVMKVVAALGLRLHAAPASAACHMLDNMNTYHLAQVNIALARAEMTSDVMSGFVARLDEINRLAEQSKGFVWRLVGDGSDATSIRAFDDPLMLVNMSVWEDIESLRTYAYKTAHVDLIRDRDAWFHKLPEAHQALWWIPAGQLPTVQEAKARLEHIRMHGPSPFAFTFAKPFPQPA